MFYCKMHVDMTPWKQHNDNNEWNNDVFYHCFSFIYYNDMLKVLQQTKLILL